MPIAKAVETSSATQAAGAGTKSKTRNHALLAGSHRNQSSTATRTSRFNNRPVRGSHMVAARDFFERTNANKNLNASGDTPSLLGGDLEARAEAIAALFGRSWAERGSTEDRNDAPANDHNKNSSSNNTSASSEQWP
mmetsp:Transcript_8382/g.16238  ORF Transcript_8382/g.16238 Transcript_8382/m.16238 type:complete len:137 (-) Transcript_8382:203-613(-)